MNTKVNPKAAAWDIIGGKFWKQGRKSARPSQTEIQMFLSGTAPGERCGILGASTKELVEAAVARQLDVTVFDFSAVMLDDLKSEIGEDSCEYIRLDALEAVPDVLRGSLRFALADRLINRFMVQEVPVFLQNVLALLVTGGELRMTVKLGLYPMDALLIEEGRRRGTLARFYNEDTRTLDYACAMDELKACLVPHGSIPRELLLDWYMQRGKESRFDSDAIRRMLFEANRTQRRFCDIEELNCPDAPGTVMYRAKVIERPKT